MDEVIKVTSRRVNALEHVVIPRIQGIIDYIKKVLDEQAREDFFRLKKLTDKKKRAKEQAIREKEIGKSVAVDEEEDMFGEEQLEFGANEKSAIEAAIGDEDIKDLIF